MSAWDEKQRRSPWGMALVVALLVMGGLIFLIRFPSVPEVTSETEGMPAGATALPSVGLTRLDQTAGDNVLRDEATLFDPTPLFLPTEWNVSQKELPNNLIRDSGRIFENYPAKLTFNESRLELGLPPTTVVPDKPMDALALLEPEQPFMGMGRVEREVVQLEDRMAFIAITVAGTGRTVLTQAIAAGPIPAGNWRPMEFLVAVDTAGLVGPPAIVTRSGVEQVDGFFQNLIAKTLRVGERLAPGTYQISVGP